MVYFLRTRTHLLHAFRLLVLSDCPKEHASPSSVILRRAIRLILSRGLTNEHPSSSSRRAVIDPPATKPRARLFSRRSTNPISAPHCRSYAFHHFISYAFHNFRSAAFWQDRSGTRTIVNTRGSDTRDATRNVCAPLFRILERSAATYFASRAVFRDHLV
jgi:hypothetical protein